MSSSPRIEMQKLITSNAARPLRRECWFSADNDKQKSASLWLHPDLELSLQAPSSTILPIVFGQMLPHRPPSPFFTRAPDALYLAHDKVRTFSAPQFNSKRYSS